MLKIKDNVDLKELEKFGFIRKYKTYSYSSDGEGYENRCTIVITENKSCSVDKRKIFIEFCEINSAILNVLYDLIQAGLVEKVVEDD